MTGSFWRAPPRRPLVIAHRGGALLAAENTAQAFLAAQACGADAVETDVRETRDGALVCVHDADLERLCGDPRRVADIDLATLRGLLPGVMTLAEAIAASAPLALLLDVKLMDAAVLPAIFAAVSQAAANPRICLGLRALPLIAAARTLCSDIALLAFAADPDCAARARADGADWFRLWQGQATPARAEAIRNAGLRLAVMVGQPRSVARDDYPPFPVGQVDRAGLETIAALEPDAILLDDPRLLPVTGVSSG